MLLRLPSTGIEQHALHTLSHQIIHPLMKTVNQWLRWNIRGCMWKSYSWSWYSKSFFYIID